MIKGSGMSFRISPTVAPTTPITSAAMSAAAKLSFHVDCPIKTSVAFTLWRLW
jgi:hypothetical protein